MSEQCDICGKDRSFAWTDTHGVAQCTDCGAPYRLYHYDENDKRLDKPPECTVNPEMVEQIQRFHKETGARLSAVGMGLSVPGGYDVATAEDVRATNEWFAEAKD